MAGRPRGFDEEDALAAVKTVFWKEGYEGASMSAMEAATGLKKQSLYRLYGDKRGLYLAAFDHYARNEVRAGLDILTGFGTAAERVKAFFDLAVADAETGDRLGCFVCAASLDQADHDPASREAVGRQIERLRYGLFVALSASEPYATNETRRLNKASELLAVYFGLRVMARSGAPVALMKSAAAAAVAGI
ncbi:MAG: TetR/AcrR family transcriptional regulator [Pseudomonadota bacterium]